MSQEVTLLIILDRELKSDDDSLRDSEICNLPAEAKKIADDKWLEKYKQQVADLRQCNDAELYEVRRVTKCHILKEPFEQCRKKQFYYSVKWEVQYGSEGNDDEGEKKDVIGFSEVIKRLKKEQ